jgi:hypothetical protein
MVPAGSKIRSCWCKPHLALRLPKAHVDAFQGTVPIPRLARRPLITLRMLTSRCRPPCRFGGISFIGVGLKRALDRTHDGGRSSRAKETYSGGGSRPRWPVPLVEPGAVFAHLVALRCRRVALAG